MLGFWIGHGGLDQLTTVAGIATATGQLTALYGTYLALIQLLLMSRSAGAGPHLRARPADPGASMDRLCDGLAARRSRRLHHGRLRARRR